MTTRTWLALALCPVVPLPLAAQKKGAATAAPVVADSLALQPATRQSWTSDKTRLGIGDVVTIVIDERTSASANLSDKASNTKKSAMSLDVEPPATGGKTSSIAVKVGSDNAGSSVKSGDTQRTNNFRSVMSARVIAVSPTGMVQLRGHKMVNVDKNMQDVVVTGWVRPQDISPSDNTVASSRIADATIDYAQSGALGNPKTGIISKMLGLIWP